MKIGYSNNWLECIMEPYSKKSDVIKYRGRYSIFECICGNTKEIKIASVKNGNTKSCGCMKNGGLSEEILPTWKNAKKHRLYQTWVRQRNEMCDEWKSLYENFYNWALDKWFSGSYIHRDSTKEKYSPTNCRFVEKHEHSELHAQESIIKRKETLVEKYGSDKYKSIPSILDKIKKTCMERYGSTSPLSNLEVREKIVATNNSRYGCDNPIQNIEIKNKTIATNLERYGVENPLSNEDVRNKINSTNLVKYGNVCPSKNIKVKQKAIDTCMSKYGKPYFTKHNKKTEKQVTKIIEELSGKPFSSNWSILDGKEIDIYNDELKIGIEFCGIYWHSEHRSGTRNSHHYKYKTCKEKGIRLITIFSDEWANRQQQVIGFLKSVLGKSKHKLFARKCTLRPVDKVTGRDFIEKYHIQGRKTFSIAYFGLYYNEELISVMSFNKHHRGNDGLVLDRFVTKEDYTIVGGASKLLKAGMEFAKSEGYIKIISWSDNRWSYGNVYERLGFELDKEMYPDYSYVSKKQRDVRRSKQSSTKKQIECKLNQTEKERMLELGYARIWDCGKIRWVLYM